MPKQPMLVQERWVPPLLLLPRAMPWVAVTQTDSELMQAVLEQPHLAQELALAWMIQSS
jgi:hypothetical protein